MQTMSDIALAALILLAQAAIGFFILKLLPSAITKLVETEIQLRSDSQLEKLKGQIEGSYATLKTSMEMLMASNTGMHPHIIESVSELWALMVLMKKNFHGLVSLDQFFTNDELKKAFNDPENNNVIIAFAESYKDEYAVLENNAAAQDSSLDKHRLFCGDRIWLIFFTSRAIYIRSAFLITRSFHENMFHDWREDGGIRQLLSAVLPEEQVDNIRSREIGGFSAVVSILEAEFLHEATRVMSGSKAMADNLTNMRSVLSLQTAEIAANVGKI